MTEGNVVLGSLNGTLRRGATTIPGMVGKALYIDGNRAYVDFGTHTTGCFFNPSHCNSGMTVAFWLKIFEGIKSSFETFLENGGCLFRAVGFCISGVPGKLQFSSRGEISGFNAAIPLPSVMQWTFVTVSMDAAKMNIYADGCYTSPSREESWTRINPLSMQVPFMIGDKDYAIAHFAIDNIRVWYTELTPDDIWELYSNTINNI